MNLKYQIFAKNFQAVGVIFQLLSQKKCLFCCTLNHLFFAVYIALFMYEFTHKFN